MDILDAKTLQRLLALRHEIHMYPETAFEQFETRKRIRAILNEFGVEDAQMQELQPTALVVDLVGKAAPSGKPKCIAYRADMDALNMEEANQTLTYRSKVQNKAHMCGHDGHMTCLAAFVPVFMRNIDKIPSDKKVRLLFQPSEQGPKSGAERMIKDGCLEGVDEVYGFHQWPTSKVGELMCKQGPVMSEITILRITIIGTSGHGSEPEKCKESLRAGVRFYQRALDFLDNLRKQKSDKFVCTLPIFKAGERYNVISEKVFISGSIRSFEQGLNMFIVSKLTQLLEQAKAEGFTYEFDYHVNAPINSNTKQQAQHVLRAGRKVFGAEKAGQGVLPVRASEDFAFFTKHKPGAFFFLSSAKGDNDPMVHNCNFNFNDDLIVPAARVWWELARDRLELE